ncbi:MAG: aminodeoxychorismate synthase component I [Maricaulaceae bacterium]
MTPNAYILLDDQLAGTVRYYDSPIEIITAWTSEEVLPALAQMQTASEAGHYLAGYCAYEMGHVLEVKLADNIAQRAGEPLLQFGVFTGFGTEAPEGLETGADRPVPRLHLCPEWNEAEYLSRYRRVIDYIEAGDVYQINLCFPMRGAYDGGSAYDLYIALRARQPVHYGGVVSLKAGGPEIVSLSPELFFRQDGKAMTMSPMKGTVKRAEDAAEDAALKAAMRVDAKSQAENLMIVDLLRNDLSRLAARGSVKVPELFALETYPTLHQMTSTVTAELAEGADIRTLFESLFPCGSVTGAPKIRAMEIIKVLETAPRGAYCGALGYIDPPTKEGNQGAACFNVGIRTLILKDGDVRYNIGSGVVLDSVGVDEYAECLLKAQVVRGDRPDLIETFKRTADGEFVRLERHLARLRRSAEALEYIYDEDQVMLALNGIDAVGDLRVRLTLAQCGEVGLATSKFAPLTSPLTIAVSRATLTPAVQETAHKVSARSFYDGERGRVKAACGADEVIFLNAKGEICEGSFTSIFLKRGDHYVTPALSCGLLPGVLREEMVETGQAIEAILTLDELMGAEICMGNSLRDLIRVKLISYELV